MNYDCCLLMNGDNNNDAFCLLLVQKYFEFWRTRFVSTRKVLDSWWWVSHVVFARGPMRRYQMQRPCAEGKCPHVPGTSYQLLLLLPCYCLSVYYRRDKDTLLFYVFNYSNYPTEITNYSYDKYVGIRVLVARKGKGKDSLLSYRMIQH